MLLSLGDPSERVVSAVHQVFIPAFAAWTTELGTLQTALIPSLLARIEKLLMVRACALTCHPLVYIQYILYVCVCVYTTYHFQDTEMARWMQGSHHLSLPSPFSKESTVWMNTSYTCSCRPCSLSSLLCLLWCCRTHPSPAEPNSTETYLQ